MIRALSHKTPSKPAGYTLRSNARLGRYARVDFQLDCYCVYDSWASFELHQFLGSWLSSSSDLSL
jgi:hypothetical protein